MSTGINDLVNMTTNISSRTVFDFSNFTKENVTTTATSSWPTTGTLSMAILLLVLCLPAVASNLANGLYLYKKRPLSARHMALLGSSGKRAPQELLLLNLSLNDMLLSLICFVIVGASTLQSSYQHGAALQSIIVTMVLEYITSTLLAMRSALLMLAVIERAHSSRHSRQHGLLQEQQFFQRSLWIVSILNTAFSLIDCVVKYDTLGTRLRRFVVLNDDFTSENCTMPHTTMYCFMYSPSVIWWNWLTFSLRYAVPTVLCVILGAVAVTNYFRALRAAVRAVVVSGKSTVARHLRATAVAAHLTATAAALEEKRARVRRASLKLGLFVLASVVCTVLLVLAITLVVTPETASPFDGGGGCGVVPSASTSMPDLVLTRRGENHSSYADVNTTTTLTNVVVDCRTIGIPNYILTSHSTADSQLPWILTFFILLTTLIDPIAVGLSYSVPPLESTNNHHLQLVGGQATRIAGGHQVHQPQFPPPRQRAALNELIFRIYHIILLPTLAWLHMTLYEPTARFLQAAARLACPSRMFKVQQALIRRRRRMAGGAELGGGDSKNFGQYYHSAEFHRQQQQQYQNMMQFMNNNNLNNNNNNITPYRTAPFFHIAVQQQQRLRVLNQGATAAAAAVQPQNNNRQILLTIENYINVSQVHQIHQTTATTFGQRRHSAKIQKIKIPPPQQVKLLMPNDMSDIGDIMRPGTSSVVPERNNKKQQSVYNNNNSTSAVVVVEQMPPQSINNSSTTQPKNSESTNKILRPSNNNNNESSSSKKSDNRQKSAHHQQQHYVQHIWSTTDTTTAVQFVRLGGEVRLPATTAVVGAAESSAADFRISRLPSLSESF